MPAQKPSISLSIAPSSSSSSGGGVSISSGQRIDTPKINSASLISNNNNNRPTLPPMDSNIDSVSNNVEDNIVMTNTQRTDIVKGNGSPSVSTAGGGSTDDDAKGKFEII